jgi:hypothetical protein
MSPGDFSTSSPAQYVSPASNFTTFAELPFDIRGKTLRHRITHLQETQNLQFLCWVKDNEQKQIQPISEGISGLSLKTFSEDSSTHHTSPLLAYINFAKLLFDLQGKT